jgi:hypothetical protein
MTSAAHARGSDGLDRAIEEANHGGRELVGSNAVDCGEAGIEDRDRARADACIVAAFTAKRPFIALVYLQGVDSVVGHVLAGTPSGMVRRFSFDSDPSGGGNVGAQTYVRECLAPEVVDVRGAKRLVCNDDPESPHPQTVYK